MLTRVSVCVGLCGSQAGCEWEPMPDVELLTSLAAASMRMGVLLLQAVTEMLTLTLAITAAVAVASDGVGSGGGGGGRGRL